MPRARRIHYEGAVYHVTSRGNERRKIVTDDADRWMFVRLLGEMVEENEVICHAWVLMDNHYHLLLERNKGVRPTFNTLKGDCFLVVFGYVKTWTLQKEKTKR